MSVNREMLARALQRVQARADELPADEAARFAQALHRASKEGVDGELTLSVHELDDETAEALQTMGLDLAENYGLLHEREGEPWMPEESLLVLVEPLPNDGGVPPAAFEAFEALRGLREASISAVTAFHTEPIAQLSDAMLALEEALQVGIDWEETDSA